MSRSIFRAAVSHIRLITRLTKIVAPTSKATVVRAGEGRLIQFTVGTDDKALRKDVTEQISHIFGSVLPWGKTADEPFCSLDVEVKDGQTTFTAYVGA